MTKLKWLTNAGKDQVRHDPYYRDKIIGRPKATESYSVEELQAMGIVGVYKVVADEAPRQSA